MKDNNTWISVKDALPERSGKYMVACTREGERKPYYYAYISYSIKHKQWNNYDSHEKSDSPSFCDVSHWLIVPEVEEMNDND